MYNRNSYYEASKSFPGFEPYVSSNNANIKINELKSNNIIIDYSTSEKYVNNLKDKKFITLDGYEIKILGIGNENNFLKDKDDFIIYENPLIRIKYINKIIINKFGDLFSDKLINKDPKGINKIDEVYYSLLLKGFESPYARIYSCIGYEGSSITDEIIDENLSNSKNTGIWIREPKLVKFNDNKYYRASYKLFKALCNNYYKTLNYYEYLDFKNKLLSKGEKISYTIKKPEKRIIISEEFESYCNFSKWYMDKYKSNFTERNNIIPDYTDYDFSRSKGNRFNDMVLLSKEYLKDKNLTRYPDSLYFDQFTRIIDKKSVLIPNYLFNELIKILDYPENTELPSGCDIVINDINDNKLYHHHGINTKINNIKFKELNNKFKRYNNLDSEFKFKDPEIAFLFYKFYVELTLRVFLIEYYMNNFNTKIMPGPDETGPDKKIFKYIFKLRFKDRSKIKINTDNYKYSDIINKIGKPIEYLKDIIDSIISEYTLFYNNYKLLNTKYIPLEPNFIIDLFSENIL